jgi:hypothetical protein
MVQQPPGISDSSQASQASPQPFSGPAYKEYLWPGPPNVGPPHQFMSGRRLRAQFGVTAPYSDSKRIGYGLLWAAWTVVLAIAGFGLLFDGSVFSGLLSLVLAFLAGRYDYRIWSWQAKRLLFFIVW